MKEALKKTSPHRHTKPVCRGLCAADFSISLHITGQIQIFVFVIQKGYIHYEIPCFIRKNKYSNFSEYRLQIRRRLMDQCTCYHSTTEYHIIRPLAEQFSPARDQQIREKFPSVKPMNEKPLAISKHAPTAPLPERKPMVFTHLRVTEYEYNTGYARIDNAIIDALRGQSQEVKDNVYDLIRKDLLPNNVHGLSEDDRLALISLGVEKAQYLADQFMDDRTKASFMEAIRSTARIGAAGKRVGTCDMEYNVKKAYATDGYNRIREDILNELLFSMEKDDPEAFAEYKKKSGGNAALFAMEWLIHGNFNLLNANKPKYRKHQDEQYKKLNEGKLDNTFSGADTSNKKNFLAALSEKLQAGQALQASFFLERIARMAEAPDNYLYSNRIVLWTRG